MLPVILEVADAGHAPRLRQVHDPPRAGTRAHPPSAGAAHRTAGRAARSPATERVVHCRIRQAGRAVSGRDLELGEWPAPDANLDPTGAPAPGRGAVSADRLGSVTISHAPILRS